jgi:type IV pilus assembly protein PilE
MHRQRAFTLLELMIALGVVGILSTLAFMNYNSSVERSNFRNMREVAAKLALSQQEHRQRHGRYAGTVSATGTSSATNMLFSEATDYTVRITASDFRTFNAEITPSRATFNTPTNCRTVVVNSNQGYLTYSSLSADKKNSTNDCMPNG